MAIPQLTFAAANAVDETLRFALFADVKSDELGLHGWEPAQRLPLLRMQFDARRHGYDARFPSAEERIIFEDGDPAGWVIVHESSAALRCVDIALRAAVRGRGLGTVVLRALQERAAAAGRPVVLSVQRSNVGALALYSRLGFRETSGTETHISMEWRHA